MNVVKVVPHHQEELFMRLREVPLNGQPDTKPYKNAKITVEEVDPKALQIAQLYLMNQGIRFLTLLRSQLFFISSDPIDIFNLHGYLSVTYDDGTTSDYLPPVVEEQSDGKLLICDGAHRCALTIRSGEMTNVVVIRGIPKEYPYYALPNVNGWNDVQYVDTPPDVKKAYRIANYRSLFRDFNSVFTNVTRKR